MEVTNKNFYILLLIFAALVAGIIAILYVNSQKKQKAFESALNELKDEALKHLRNHVEPPFTPYEEVKDQSAQEPAATTTQEALVPQAEPAKETPTAPLVQPQFTATVTQKISPDAIAEMREKNAQPVEIGSTVIPLEKIPTKAKSVTQKPKAPAPAKKVEVAQAEKQIQQETTNA